MPAAASATQSRSSARREPATRDAERAHELERHRHAERDAVERLVEGEVHPGERRRRTRATSQQVVARRRARGRQIAASSTRRERARRRKTVPPGPSVVEQGLGERAPDLHGGDCQKHEQREPARRHRNPRHNRRVATTVASAGRARSRTAARLRGARGCVPATWTRRSRSWTSTRCGRTRPRCSTRAAGKPIRVASKSVRCRALLKRRARPRPRLPRADDVHARRERCGCTSRASTTCCSPTRPPTARRSRASAGSTPSGRRS